jgi:signal peptidase I
MKIIDPLKKFYNFLQKDSWASFITTLFIAFIIIKFIFFPGLSLITGTTLPLVIVESCSMYHHEKGFEKILESDIYDSHGIDLEDTTNWIFQNGFNKGDVIFVLEAKNIEIGDVIIFNGGLQHPLIHRVIEVGEDYGTKGDNYITNSGQLASERSILEDQLVGKALFKIPFIGWAKLIFFETGRPASQRGMCD